MKLLIIDTETTGLAEKVDQVIEVAGVLFDVELRDVICQLSFVLPCDDNAARHINKIAPEVTQASGTPLTNAMMKSFYKMVAQADYLVAHNAAFDKKWFGEGQGLFPLDVPWICSMEDIRWPRSSKKGRPSVVSLALDYGVPVWSAHRALTDCIYLAEIMKREPALKQIIKESLEPTKIYISMLPYESRQQCKDAGFTWNDIVPKKWAKKMKESELKTVGFQVSEAVL